MDKLEIVENYLMSKVHNLLKVELGEQSESNRIKMRVYLDTLDWMNANGLTYKWKPEPLPGNLNQAMEEIEKTEKEVEEDKLWEEKLKGYEGGF